VEGKSNGRSGDWDSLVLPVEFWVTLINQGGIRVCCSCCWWGFDEKEVAFREGAEWNVGVVIDGICWRNTFEEWELEG
jgi:hypothetical protein